MAIDGIPVSTNAQHLGLLRCFECSGTEVRQTSLCETIHEKPHSVEYLGVLDGLGSGHC